MEQLVNFIIRPPRAEYNPQNDLLDQEFMLKGKWFQRKDLEITNSRGDVLKCSHYLPIVSPEGKPLPCVIYCHGNSGCRADASEAAIILLPSNITVFTLDFSGSGLSGGEHVTLGWYEKDDLRSVVDYLREDGNVSLIGLWGRSMGSVTSLMYGAEDPSIAGMVLDSPFSDLVDLMMELVDTYRFRLPKFTVKFAIQYMRKAVQRKAKFDIVDLNTIKVAKSCFVPVLLGHAIDDDFIRPHHSERIYDAYMGDKNIIKFDGDHNSPRPQFYFDSINIFFHNVLQPPEDEVAAFDRMHDYFGRGNWTTLHDVGYAEKSLVSSGGPVACSTEDAIRQLRSKRPMSRTEVPSGDAHSEAEEEGNKNDSFSSSSKMISFELSNGHPYGPHVPTSVDDDQYVEYSFDDLADFPCNVEEEERMLMEAVMESLKDLEVKSPQVEQPSSVGNGSTMSSRKDGPGASSFDEQCRPLETEASAPSLALQIQAESVSNSVITGPEVASQIQTKSISYTSTSGPTLTSQHPSPDTSVSSAGPANDFASSFTESGTTSTSSRSDTVSIQSPSDTDISGGTKATVTVVKNPTSHIMDGLLRRWDLNFFRNGR